MLEWQSGAPSGAPAAVDVALPRASSKGKRGGRACTLRARLTWTERTCWPLFLLRGRSTLGVGVLWQHNAELHLQRVGGRVSQPRATGTHPRRAQSVEYAVRVLATWCLPFSRGGNGEAAQDPGYLDTRCSLHLTTMCTPPVAARVSSMQC